MALPRRTGYTARNPPSPPFLTPRRKVFVQKLPRICAEAGARQQDFGWVDCPGLIRASGAVYEYPMVDREPLPSWTEGCVTLMGDAAHATYPVGSNGATQAIIDARKLGAAFRDHGVNRKALLAYEAEMRPRAEGILRANRGKGPDAVMQMVEDRCGGIFDDIETIIPRAELAAHAEHYKRLSGFSIEALNAQPPILGPMAGLPR